MQTLNAQDWIVVGIVIALLYAIRLRREAIRYALRRLILMCAACFGVIAYLQKNGSTSEVVLFGGLIAAVIVDAFIPKRSRHIPKSERRKVVRDFESRTGQKYDPRLHDLDHTIPFSRGGSNTPDNLRVTTRRENRSKGAKSPWWDLLGR